MQEVLPAQLKTHACLQVTRDSPGDLLELYCGNGNFTIPMAQNFKQVVATEVRSRSSCCNVSSASRHPRIRSVSELHCARPQRVTSSLVDYTCCNTCIAGRIRQVSWRGVVCAFSH